MTDKPDAKTVLEMAWIGSKELPPRHCIHCWAKEGEEEHSALCWVAALAASQQTVATLLARVEALTPDEWLDTAGVLDQMAADSGPDVAAIYRKRSAKIRAARDAVQTPAKEE